MKTTDDVQEWGLYASSCCGEEVVFDKDDCFTRCPRCERLCNWELIENLIPSETLENSAKDQAA